MSNDTGTLRTRALFPRPFLLCAVFAVLSTLLFAEIVPRYAPGLLRFEHVLGDVRTSYLADQLPSQHPHVAVVSITDETLKDNKVRQPIDRALLARLVDAIDAAGPKVIGIDVLLARTPPPDNEDLLIDAIKRAKAQIVLAAADARIDLPKAHFIQQEKLIAAIGRPAGYINLATERDWVIRFKALPLAGSPYPKSFAALLAAGFGIRPEESYRRIAWLREPMDRSDTFLTVPAEILLKAPDAASQNLRAGLKNKIVIIGGLFPDIDRHLTPLTARANELQPGAVIHAHIAAEMVDGRRIIQLETDSLALKLALLVVAALAFLIGWRFRHTSQGLLLGSLATVAIIAVDTFVFWRWRIILPIVLALLAWFLSEFTGRYIGRWLGARSTGRSKWFIK
ncbi:MAG: CHASE2 domain-containing protein [Sphingomonadales bacterium]|nr:CHASE2 domain-containing protein [Sphingomonadales bacterium]